MENGHFKKTAQSENGFVTIVGLSAFVLIACLVFTLMFYLEWRQSNEKIVHKCRETLLGAQERASVPLDALLKLNPVAKALRVAHQAAQAAVAVAIASKNPVAIAKALSTLEKIQKKKAKLETVQKKLIQTANTAMDLGMIHAKAELHRSHRLGNGKHPFVRQHLSNVSGSERELAVEPDNSSEVAPLYQLKPNFQSEQKLQISYVVATTIKKGGQIWTERLFTRREICGASLRKNGSEYVATIEGKW